LKLIYYLALYAAVFLVDAVNEDADGITAAVAVQVLVGGMVGYLGVTGNPVYSSHADWLQTL